MEGIDQFTTLMLAGKDSIGVRVDYQPCDRCGFRLKRVETTIIADQRMIVTRCPICEQFDNDDSRQVDASLQVDDRSRYFEAWLATHGLNRDMLEIHYHLRVDHFFNDDR